VLTHNCTIELDTRTVEKKTVSVVVDWVSDQTMTIYEDALSSNGTQEAGTLPRYYHQTLNHKTVKCA